MKGFLSTAGTVSTCGTSPSTCPATTNNTNPSSKSSLNLADVKLDISSVKKTPTLGLHRIAKLLGSNDNKSNRPVENKTTNGSIDHSRDRDSSTVSLVEVKETNQVQKKVPTEATPPIEKKWGRLSKGEIIIAKDLKCEVIKDTNDASKDAFKDTSSESATDTSARCNGKLQRTKRIDQDADGAEDKESLTSVTIISVPSNLMDAPIANFEKSTKVNNNPVAPMKSQHLKIENCNNSLIKQASLPAPTLIQQQSLKRCQTPNSGWL